MFQFRNISSSFNGKICEIPSICVDNFEKASTDRARAYFLSHFHTDHTVGLDREALKSKLRKKKNIFIYATKMTAAIIVYNNCYLEDYVKVLNLGSNLISIPGDEEENEPEMILNVTLIPAGHCIGSTMYLFETTSVKVLYTGDFRIRPNDLSKYAAFHNKDGEIIHLDAIYMDTTFIDTHESFPKRTDSIEEVIVLIRGYLESKEEQRVILDTSATYGYEYVFNEIYKKLGMKVCVDAQKWKFYSTIRHLVPGVTNNSHETRIFLKCIPDSIQWLPPKRIKFSAMRWNDWNEDKTSIDEKGHCVYVCFSTHCSRMELTSFVDYLNPAKVIGFPNPYKLKCSPSKESFSDKFVPSPKKTPLKMSEQNKPSQEDKMVDKAVLRKIFG